jgi:hypothetical protein
LLVSWCRPLEDALDQRGIAVLDHLDQLPVSYAEQEAVRLVIGVPALGRRVSVGMDHDPVSLGDDQVRLASIAQIRRHEPPAGTWRTKGEILR